MLKRIKLFGERYLCYCILFGIAFSMVSCVSEQVVDAGTKPEKKTWHGHTRSVRYLPDGEDFVITNGDRRFNRALYGSHTEFRVEAGDLPEFALYLPGMGGNFKFGLVAADEEKWLIDAEEIVARYRAGSMLYEIKDPLLGKGKLLISVLAMFDAEGMLIKTQFVDVREDVELVWTYGGVSGKKFSRGGDLGTDPESSFYLKPENCKDNVVVLEEGNAFELYFGEGRVAEEREVTTDKIKRSLAGVFPEAADLKIVDAEKQSTPQALWQSNGSDFPVLAGKLVVKNAIENYFTVYNPHDLNKIHYAEAKALFDKAEQERQAIAGRVTVKTPDPYINTLGGALAIAADGIWEHPSYLHGAVAWRMPLSGWRGAFVADWLGWHDRAKTHFSSYAKAQYTGPASGSNVPDPKANMTRQLEEVGTALFTDGYISRRPGVISKPHHYDMNMVFIDQMLRHFDWTADTAFLKEMWPVVQRHLAWETRNFDGDGDGLYNAYASIWASDALGYNGGGVAHSSAYNYFAFKNAARLAGIIGEDPTDYKKEAEKILNALNTILWMPEKGWYGEYKDILGNKRLHTQPGLWSVYHVMDSQVPDPFQAYQLLRYVDKEIPHIPIVAEGMPDGDYHLLSTTNWMPYTWSVNNVALAEVLHTSLAYWQGGKSEDAFTLWKSALLESMYLGGSPGNFHQLSFYDAMRGELYRDNADPVGMASRTLVEGLFGIMPDLLNNTLKVNVGLPEAWDYAALETPEVSFDFKRKGNTDTYTIEASFKGLKHLNLQVKAQKESVKKVLVNGEEVSWKVIEEAVGRPHIAIVSPLENKAQVEIEWIGAHLEVHNSKDFIVESSALEIAFDKAKVLKVFDPQNAIVLEEQQQQKIKASVQAQSGHKSVFVQMSQGSMRWWEPITFEVRKPLEIIGDLEQPKDMLTFKVKNNTDKAIEGKILVNPLKTSFSMPIKLAAGEIKGVELNELSALNFGNNVIAIEWEKGQISTKVANWNIHPAKKDMETVNLADHFNDQVTNIFKNEYLSPRSPYPTLQLPVHGLGDWCSFGAYMEIDDSGLRKLAEEDDVITLPQGISFATPGESGKDNIVFTSLWDNYPDEVAIPLTGKASHAYLLMAGSTNPMQSRIENGVIEITYTDGSSSMLSLENPQTWWPIEQDYYVDEYAFKIGVPKPVRVHLKTGWMGTEFKKYVSIGNFTKFAVDGGAATVLDIPLDPDKTLQQLTLKTTANDVVIGLMGLTLVRE